MEAMLARLSPSEQKRVHALLEERAVRQYVVSRAMQRHLLASYVGGAPARSSFGVVAMGKPTLSHPNDIGLTFNTTHSGNLVIIAVTANRDVGVDVEKVKPIPRALRVARRSFAESEYEMLAALPPDELDRAFCRSGFAGREQRRLAATAYGVVSPAGTAARSKTPRKDARGQSCPSISGRNSSESSSRGAMTGESR